MEIRRKLPGKSVLKCPKNTDAKKDVYNSAFLCYNQGVCAGWAAPGKAKTPFSGAQKEKKRRRETGILRFRAENGGSVACFSMTFFLITRKNLIFERRFDTIWLKN
ncbi:MAG: hypothetical protein ACI3VZ_00180 [Faecousia sp.]